MLRKRRQLSSYCCRQNRPNLRKTDLLPIKIDMSSEKQRQTLNQHLSYCLSQAHLYSYIFLYSHQAAQGDEREFCGLKIFLSEVLSVKKSACSEASWHFCLKERLFLNNKDFFPFSSADLPQNAHCVSFLLQIILSSTCYKEISHCGLKRNF